MALHTYTPTEWKNAPDHKTTPLNATNLNNIETGIENAYTDISTIDSAVADKAEQDDLTSISETGATASQAIGAGTYFYLNGTFVKAKVDIANGATFTENTNYEAATVGDALTWKYFDEISGANSKATPSDFRELLLSVANASYAMTFYIPKIDLSNTEKAYTSGSWRDSNTARLSALVRVSLSSISLVWMYANGINDTASSKCRIYYR